MINTVYICDEFQHLVRFINHANHNQPNIETTLTMDCIVDFLCQFYFSRYHFSIQLSFMQGTNCI